MHHYVGLIRYVISTVVCFLKVVPSNHKKDWVPTCRKSTQLDTRRTALWGKRLWPRNCVKEHYALQVSYVESSNYSFIFVCDVNRQILGVHNIENPPVSAQWSAPHTMGKNLFMNTDIKLVGFNYLQSANILTDCHARCTISYKFSVCRFKVQKHFNKSFLFT